MFPNLFVFLHEVIAFYQEPFVHLLIMYSLSSYYWYRMLPLLIWIFEQSLNSLLWIHFSGINNLFIVDLTSLISFCLMSLQHCSWRWLLAVYSWWHYVALPDTFVKIPLSLFVYFKNNFIGDFSDISNSLYYQCHFSNIWSLALPHSYL